MENNKSFQYAEKNKLHFSVQSFFVGAILSVTFFLLLVDACKTYTSNMTILVSAKSEFALQQHEQIMENIIELPRTLSFYDSMLKYNPDVRDVAEGQNQDKRKAIWNKMLSIERDDRNSSVIKISITAKQESDADQLVQKTARLLLDTTGIYYNVKDDIDLRIIDGPVSSAGIVGWYWMLPFSLALGFFVALFLENIFLKSEKLFVGNRNFLKEKNLFDFKKEIQKSSELEIKDLEDLYMQQEAGIPFFAEEEKQNFLEKDFSKTSEADSRIKEMKKLTKQIQQDKYPNFPEMPVREIKKSSAPENLPVADDSFFGKLNSDSIDQQKKPEIKIPAEPTEEELKKRLNQLIRGEL